MLFVNLKQEQGIRCHFPEVYIWLTYLIIRDLNI